MPNPNGVAPPSFTATNIVATLDYTNTQTTWADLNGTTFSAGGRTYTFGTDTFVRHDDDDALLDPNDIAIAVAATINLDSDFGGIYYDPTSVQNANEVVYAYSVGTVVNLVSTEASTTPGPPSPPTSPFSNTKFSSGTATTTPAAISDFTTVGEIAVENLGDVDLILNDGTSNFILRAGLGTTFYGNASTFDVRVVSGTSDFQVKIAYNV